MASPDPVRRAAGEGGGSGDGRGGNKGFRLFGAWIQGPGDEATNRGGGGRQQRQREGEEQGECCAAVAGGESSRHGQGARRCRGPARRPMSTATPWTTEEHRRFLRGLEEKGKGKWAAIAKEFVKTRNGTQVASHAQKHFLRQQKEAAGVKSRGISIFGVALEAEEGGDDAAGAGESQGPGSVEAPQPDPSPRAPPLAPETPHRGPSSLSSPPQHRTPSPREVAPPPQPHGPFLLGVGAAPPPPMLHLAPPHAAFLPCQNVKFDPWVVPWPAPPWAAPVWLTGPSFAATHGQLQHHHHPFQQQLASVAPSSLSQNSEESSTDLATAA